MLTAPELLPPPRPLPPPGTSMAGRRRRPLRWVALAVVVAVGVLLQRDALPLVPFLFVAVVPFEKLFPRHRQRLRRPGLGTDLAYAVSEPVLVAADRSVRVLILTTFDHDEYLDGALRAGAAGFLLKNSTPEELVRAVQRVAAGEHVLDPAVTGRVIARFASRHAPAVTSRDVARLTAREQDVLALLALLARDRSNAEIAIELRCGEATAKSHVSHVLTKLGVRDRVQAVIAAYETGFAPSDRLTES